MTHMIRLLENREIFVNKDTIEAVYITNAYRVGKKHPYEFRLFSNWLTSHVGKHLSKLIAKFFIHDDLMLSRDFVECSVTVRFCSKSKKVFSCKSYLEAEKVMNEIINNIESNKEGILNG